MKILALFLSLIAFTLPSAARAEAVILAGHPLTAGLAGALLDGTAVSLRVVVPAALPMGRQAAFLAGRGEKALAEAALGAEAVVSLRSLWPEDPLFPMARRTNIRLVEIDAGRPVDGALPGVAAVRAPSAGALGAALGIPAPALAPAAPAPWLSANALGRMADILAADLRRLHPEAAPRISANLDGLKRALLAQSARAAQAFAGLADPGVVSLSDRFAALTPDLGLDARASVALDDREWTPERTRILGDFLVGEAVRVVLAHRPPPAEVGAAISGAGAKLVILDSLESGPPVDVPVAFASIIDALLAAFPADGL
ncbi:ABC transporter periplasmic substrate-binding protein [Rhodospirillum rubrum F11]|uniref:ABC transporter, periplasmic substrate-binding protein, putative n=3 Tax=Rhodospirillum rubrum TaxID=1085 RepID=Q2RRQ8_RHORT|nr:zinc ABC transporter substrate-binding protein [Rhodospirillum rubrum]ABC23187.1 ABC transporter, periplasmic substrate-binding protein, putative [Rhodospirillum rubrum ATCC 11170]AEO48918.1 ABC transporter periplasmic substrate-binding protein [Rhodospirillum rubrum F11]MBK5954827.1 ABC transporter substrate-binding protein [Rhodospirillum rubrum]QXG79166.1 zinc ABC transporter solute-binding protein [Rhodospirillum rubrum]